MSSEHGNKILQTAALFLLLIAAYFIQAAFYQGASPHTREMSKTQPIPDFIRIQSVPTPELSAESVLIARVNTGQLLFEKNSEIPLAIGSLSKLLTAVVVAEHLDPLREIPMTTEAKIPEEDGEKISFIPAGEFFKAEDMVKLLLIDSASDAARTLASAVVSVTRPDLDTASTTDRMLAFSALMNSKALELGMASSSFANATGIDDPNSFSTATDLFLLIRYITKEHPELWTVTRTVEADIFSRERTGYHIVNTNPLLKDFPMIFGSKTGTTDEAKEALVLLYQVRVADSIAIIILKSEKRPQDAKDIIHFVETGFLIH